MDWIKRIVAALAPVLAIVELAGASDPPAKPQQAAKPVKVEFHWAEGTHVPGLTADKGIVWSERGDLIYLHKQPVLSNQDVVKVEVNKTVFGVGPLAQEHFTINFHLTKEARKRLAETCGPSGEKLLAAMVDGGHHGTPFYLKSRDEGSFVPFAGMFTSKEKVDQIVATFAPAAPGSAPNSEAPQPVKPEK